MKNKSNLDAFKLSLVCHSLSACFENSLNNSKYLYELQYIYISVYVRVYTYIYIYIYALWSREQNTMALKPNWNNLFACLPLLLWYSSITIQMQERYTWKKSEKNLNATPQTIRPSPLRAKYTLQKRRETDCKSQRNGRTDTHNELTETMAAHTGHAQV